jgi:diguanylate cyclase (GGDEF)-like protein
MDSRADIEDRLTLKGPSQDEAHRAVRNVILLTVVFLGCLWGGFAYWAINGRQEAIAEAEHRLEQMTHAVEQYARNLLKMSEVFQVTAERWLEEKSPDDPRSDAGFIALIDDFRQRTHGLIDIRMATSNGDLYYFPNGSGRAQDNVADREYFRAVIDALPGTRHIGIPVISRVSGQWRLPITMRMKHVHHGLEVINASVDLNELIATFDSERPKPDGSISFWRTDGTLLARAPQREAMVGKKDVVRWEDWQKISSPPHGLIISNATPYDGVIRLISHRRLVDLPLIVAVTASLDDTLASWRRQTLTVFASLILVTLWSVVFSSRLVGILRLLKRHSLEQERLAITDQLTGLYNRRYLIETGTREMARAHRYDKPMSLLLLDIDYFKTVNDTWGHSTGDGVLRGLAATMNAIVRDQDTVGRLGGEEFAIILPETDPKGTHFIAERIRAAIQETPMAITAEGRAITITVSIGMATVSPNDESFEAVLSRADKGLYRAKETGRNLVAAA